MDYYLYIRGDKQYAVIYLILAACLALLSAWLGYQISLGKSFASGLFETSGFSLFFGLLALSVRTNSVKISDQWLISGRLVSKHRVYLPELTAVRSGQIPAVQIVSGRNLFFEDTTGRKAWIDPQMFDSDDMVKLAEYLQPYVLKANVNCNFSDLSFLGATPLAASQPWPSIGNIAGGIAKYIFLPSLILAILTVLIVNLLD